MTTTALPLYEITDELAALVEQIQEADGVMTPEIEAAFDQLSGSFTEKVGRCIAYIRNLEALADARFKEARRLEDSAKAPSNTAVRLKAYVMEQMTKLGEKKVETSLGTARIQQNSRPSIQWPGEPATIPAPFRKVEVRLDGTAAYDAWKAKTLPDGFVVETGRHLRIA